MNIDKNKLLDILLDLSNIYNIMGDEHRSNAYYNAYYELKYDRHIIHKDMTIKELKKIKGIGESIATKIMEFIQTNNIKFYNELKNDPKFNAILTLSTVTGIGYKNAKYFVETYNVYTIDELKQLYINGNIKDVTKDVNGNIKDDFNKTQLLGLKFYDDLIQKIPKDEIKLFEHKLQKYIDDNKLMYKFEIMGSYKRGKDFSSDIDLLIYRADIIKQSDVHMKHMSEFIDILKRTIKYVGTLSFGSSKFMGLFIIDKVVRHMDVLIVPIDNLYTSIQYFTGSKEFNVKIREIAKSKGFKLNEKGLFKNNKQIKLKSEEDIFKKLNINYIDPKHR